MKIDINPANYISQASTSNGSKVTNVDKNIQTKQFRTAVKHEASEAGQSFQPQGNYHRNPKESLQ